MRKVSNLIAFFAFLAATIGLIIAAVSFFENRRGLFCEPEEDDLYDDDSYYGEDLSYFDPQPVDAAEEPATPEQSE